MEQERRPNGKAARPTANAAPTTARPPLAHRQPLGGELQAAWPDMPTELAALHRLALLGTVSAMIVHELNNLATPVLARAEDALSQDDPQIWRRALERSSVNLQKAVLLSRHLLGLASDQDSGRAPCLVGELISEALEVLTRPLEKDRITLSLEIQPDLRIRTNRLLAVQLFLNLLLNARQSMEAEGGLLRIAAAREGPLAVIDVVDSGCGLSDEAIQTRFNPFLNAADPGPLDWRMAGLGLNVCRAIAREHGARLEFLRNPGRGCTVRVFWPAD